MGRFWRDIFKLLKSHWKLADYTITGDDYYIEHLSDKSEDKSSSYELDSFMNRSSSSEDAESFFCPPQTGGESELGKRLREDTVVPHQVAQRREGEEEPTAKRLRGDVITSSADAIKSYRLKKAQRLASRMTRKVISLQREIKGLQSELHLMQQENIRLRHAHTDEDDLIRCQLEALLAEKWKLIQENNNLSREKEDLLQCIEYRMLSGQEEEDEERGISTDEDDLVRIELESQLAEKWKLRQENISLTKENMRLLQLAEYHQLKF